MHLVRGAVVPTPLTTSGSSCSFQRAGQVSTSQSRSCCQMFWVWQYGVVGGRATQSLAGAAVVPIVNSERYKIDKAMHLMRSLSF